MAEIKFNREQTAIIEHRAGNMIVSASAGSGKTTVMLERVLRIIEEGTPGVQIGRASCRERV